MTKLLTICIPTRNRLVSLGNNIEHLINLIDKYNLNKDIDILISDNSENINQSLYEKSLKVNFFKYMYSPDKGHDVNLQLLINNADSKYIWLCQDHTKILSNYIDRILDKLKNDNFDYLFLSTKKKYFIDRFIVENSKYLSFKNTYLNTNIVKLSNFKNIYNLNMNKYNESHLVWHYSIIILLFNNLDTKVYYFKNQCSIYKFFDINNEHKKMTWSFSLNNYLKILSKYTLMFDEFYENKNINNYFLKKIFRKNLHSVPTVYRLHQLNNHINHFDKSYSNFINHPTFSKLDKFIINKIIFNNSLLIKILKKFYIIELYFFILLPKLFLIKFLNKFTKVIYSSS